MMARLSKKRRLHRARAHANRIDRRLKTYGRVYLPFDVPDRKKLATAPYRLVLDARRDDVSTMTPAENLLELQREYNERMVIEGETPSRAKCPSCGFSQKVRKDGAMSRHDIYQGSAKRECEGSGRRWDSVD